MDQSESTKSIHYKSTQSEQEFHSLPSNNTTTVDLPHLPSDTRKWADGVGEALQVEFLGPHDGFYVLHTAEVGDTMPEQMSIHQFIMKYLYFNIDEKESSTTYAMKKLALQLEELGKIEEKIQHEENPDLKGKVDLMRNFVREVKTFLEIRKSASDIGAVCASLFKEFTRLVSPFLRAGSETERKALVFGNDVVSSPCMRGYSQKYVQYDGNHVKFTVAAITTVDRNEDEADTDLVENGDVSESSINEDIDGGGGDSFISSSFPHQLRKLVDTPVSSHLLSQHTGELLLELPFSCFTNPDQNVMMGFILQGTKVRITTLLMEKRHLVTIMSGKALRPSHQAQLVYSHPMDLLKKDDRAYLLEMLLRLQPYIALCN